MRPSSFYRHFQILFAKWKLVLSAFHVIFVLIKSKEKPCQGSSITFSSLSQQWKRLWVHLMSFLCSLNKNQNYTEVLSLFFHPRNNYEKGYECSYDSIFVLDKHQHNGIHHSLSSSCSLIYEESYTNYYFRPFQTRWYYSQKWSPFGVSFTLFSNSLNMKTLSSNLASIPTH